MDECFRDMGYLICIARYHPTFYSTLGAAVLAALFAYVSIKMNRKSAREKNSVDFEHNYKNSDKVRDAWLVLMKITQNRLKQPIVEFAKKEIMDKINSYFGYKLINEIKLQTFGSNINKNKKKIIIEKFSKNLQKKISEIKSENIKNSLSQLLKIIKND